MLLKKKEHAFTVKSMLFDYKLIYFAFLRRLLVGLFLGKPMVYAPSSLGQLK